MQDSSSVEKKQASIYRLGDKTAVGLANRVRDKQSYRKTKNKKASSTSARRAIQWWTKCTSSRSRKQANAWFTFKLSLYKRSSTLYIVCERVLPTLTSNSWILSYQLEQSHFGRSIHVIQLGSHRIANTELFEKKECGNMKVNLFG